MDPTVNYVLLGIALIIAWAAYRGLKKTIEAGNTVATATHQMMNSRFDAWKADTLKAAADAALAASLAAGVATANAYREGAAHAKLEAELAAAKAAEQRFKIPDPPK